MAVIGARHNSRRFNALTATAVLVSFTVVAHSAVSPSSEKPCPAGITERYTRAEGMLGANLSRLVLNETVSPHWTGRGAQFWYRRQRFNGSDYVLVDSDGKQRAAFDHERLAAAVSKTVGSTVGPWALELLVLTVDSRVTVQVGDQHVACALDKYACTVSAASTPDPTWLISPDGTRAAFARNHDLWLRDLATGDAHRLTSDGEPDYSWGKYPDAGQLTVARHRSGLKLPLWSYTWSPDGHYLVGGRLDERKVDPYPFIESVPQDGSVRPQTYWVRLALLGERGPRFELSVFDTITGRRVGVDQPAEIGTASTMLGFDVLGWNSAHTRFYGTQQTDYNREVRLLEIDAATGVVRTVLVEKSPTHVRLNALLTDNAPNIRLIKGGREVIWYSERSGWGHLYRYDIATGTLLSKSTQGEWLVRDIVHVDHVNERLYFTAGGREPGNPYYRRLYRVTFDGSDLNLLTPEDADHMIDGAPLPSFAALFGTPIPRSPVSPDGRVVVESYSTLEAPPVSVLRSTQSGAVIATLEKANASRLYATGWKPPQPFVAKAADQQTSLYGVIYWPQCGGKTPLPVIDALYGGPQFPIVPHNFPDARAGEQAAFAALGFIVVTVDGRGTPLRSQAFQEVSYGNFADPALDDHVAVLRDLGKRFPDMDLGRVGVYGHSLGGYVSARAMLRYPDVYKVGVSSAGSQNDQGMYDLSPYLMPPDYGGGVTVKPSPTAIPENYRALDNSTLAPNLKGKLLLAYGDLDENALPAVTFQFIDALIKANRSYDLLYLPNRTHGFVKDPYFIRRRWDYFVEHLRGETPPQDYSIDASAKAAGLSD